MYVRTEKIEVRLLRLKEIRLNKGITQEDLAKELNVGQNTISLWERGLRSPRVDILLKLSEFFGCTVDDLLKEK